MALPPAGSESENCGRVWWRSGCLAGCTWRAGGRALTAALSGRAHMGWMVGHVVAPGLPSGGGRGQGPWPGGPQPAGKRGCACRLGVQGRAAAGGLGAGGCGGGRGRRQGNLGGQEVRGRGFEQVLQRARSRFSASPAAAGPHGGLLHLPPGPHSFTRCGREAAKPPPTPLRVAGGMQGRRPACRPGPGRWRPSGWLHTAAGGRFH